jgi:membrane associated rhomboid family serine protease
VAGGLYAVGIAGTLLFGAGVAASISGFVPRWAHLRISPDGLVLRHVGRTKRWSWNEIEHFTAYEIHHQYGSVKQVGFDRRDLTPEHQNLWQTITRGMSGVDGALPDTYGLRHDELAALLNTARDRYATEHGPSPSMLADLELQRRADAVRRDRMPVVTAALTIVCVVVFVMEVDAYGPFPDAQELRDAGGASRDALAAGDWWTLLSANVLHVNPIHLVFNLVGLLLVGILLEREIGWRRMGLLCLVGGLASMSLGVLLQQGAGVVGISGVVYALATYALLRDVHRTRGLGYAAWAMVPAGVIYTFLMPGVSIGGHLGGLIAGFALGYAFERTRSRGTEPVLS